ncbi:MAG: thioredoxin-dependent thiol peroxidase [Pseudomonadota bacterium]
MLKEGSKAPNFSLADDSGREVSFKDLKGKRVVLYFYPKDDTPGCTKEACDFRDHYAQFANASTVIYGVSADSLESHKSFKRKYDLPFPLLADPDHKLAEAYGAWGEKTSYGKKTTGMIRSTFVIEPDGTIGKIYRNVTVDGHAESVLTGIK